MLKDTRKNLMLKDSEDTPAGEQDTPQESDFSTFKQRRGGIIPIVNGLIVCGLDNSSASICDLAGHKSSKDSDLADTCRREFVEETFSLFGCPDAEECKLLPYLEDENTLFFVYRVPEVKHPLYYLKKIRGLTKYCSLFETQNFVFLTLEQLLKILGSNCDERASMIFMFSKLRRLLTTNKDLLNDLLHTDLSIPNELTGTEEQKVKDLTFRSNSPLVISEIGSASYLQSESLFLPIITENRSVLKPILSSKCIKLVIGKNVINSISYLKLPCVNGIDFYFFCSVRGFSFGAESSYDELVDLYYRLKDLPVKRNIKNLYNRKRDLYLTCLSICNFWPNGNRSLLVDKCYNFYEGEIEQMCIEQTFDSLIEDGLLQLDF
jgi:hypothetical protein